MASRAEMAASTARTYALVGFVFYILGVLPWIFFPFGLLVFTVGMGGSAPYFPAPFPFFLLGLLFLAIPVGFTVWSYLTLREIERGRYEAARTPSLILGIFGIFLAWIIGGIFFLLAYGKLGEALEPLPPGAVQRFCTSCGRAVAADARFCAHCGNELPE